MTRLLERFNDMAIYLYTVLRADKRPPRFNPTGAHVLALRIREISS